jgi:hypothetical protein
VQNSPEGGLASAGLAVGAARAARWAHVTLGREAVARGVHLLVQIRLRAGLVGLLALGLALKLVVVLKAHGCGRSSGVVTGSAEGSRRVGLSVMRVRDVLSVGTMVSIGERAHNRQAVRRVGEGAEGARLHLP